MPHISVVLDLLTDRPLFDLVQPLSVSPEVFLSRMFFFSACDCSAQSLKDVFEVPEEGSQMSAADHDVHLDVVPHQLLLISQHVRVGTQSVRLGIHTYVGQVIGREADLKPDLCQRIQEVRLRYIRHLSLIAQPLAHALILMRRIVDWFTPSPRVLLATRCRQLAMRAQCSSNRYRRE